MIELRNVTMSYHGQKVIEDLNLTFPDTGITSLIGSNGAGKSTLLGGIGRIQEIETGQIIVDGQAINKWRQNELAKVLAILKQEQKLTMRLKVFELLLLGRYPYSHGRYNDDDYRAVAKVLEHLDLARFADEYLDELSGGQRQRAFIGMVLVQETKYILLDEPIASLDMRYSRDMMRYLRRLAHKENKSIIIVIHDINLALGYSDRIVGMQDGKVMFEGAVDAVATDENLSRLYHCEVSVSEINGRKIVFPSL